MGRLIGTARTLGRRARPGKGFPRLWLVTDPERTPDPIALARRLPSGSGIVYRHFGAPDAEAVGRGLLAVARARGLALLVGADEALAARLGADGVHLPERELPRAPRLRARRPGWIITGAAHSHRAVKRAERAGLDAAFLSAVFPSASRSAGRPMGALRLTQIARTSRIRLIALGGVNDTTAPRLAASGIYGMAAVGGLAP